MFCFELEFENESVCYIDGHNKQLMQQKDIPEVFADIMTDVKAYLINSQSTLEGNNIVQLFTYNDTKQKTLMLEFVKAFMNSTNKTIVNAALFDRGHLMMAAINNFTRLQKEFSCLLKPEEYKGLKDFKIIDDFKLLKKYEPYSHIDILSSSDNKANDILEWVSDAKYTLRDRSTNSAKSARVALVAKFMNRKASLIPIVTNTNQTVDITKVALSYLTNNKSQNLFVNIIDTIKSDENLMAQDTRPAASKHTQVLREQKGKQGLSIRPKHYEAPITPPYSKMRSIADDLSKKR